MALVRKFLRALRKLFKVPPRRRKSQRRTSHRKKRTRKPVRPRARVTHSKRRIKIKPKKIPSKRQLPMAKRPQSQGSSSAVKALSQKQADSVMLAASLTAVGSVQKSPELLIGEMTHYFSKIMVGVVKVTGASLLVGEKVRIQGSITNFTQKVESLQIESVDVRLAKKGSLVGLRVKQPCRAGDHIYKMS